MVLEESKYRSFDLGTKVIGFIISILLAVIAWNQFTTQNEKQFQSRYYEEKIEYINKVIEIVCIIEKNTLYYSITKNGERYV